MADTFQKNSFAWQQETFFRRIGEWLELQTDSSGIDPSYLPPWEWWDQFVWIFGVIAILGLAFLIYRWVRPYLGATLSKAGASLNRLPLDSEAPQSVSDWIQAAQRWQQQGNYQEACRCLYRAMLQRLDETKLIPSHASLTDGEYLRMVQILPQSDAYRTLLETHEQFQFGRLSVSADTLNRCQQAFLRIEQEPEQSP